MKINRSVARTENIHVKVTGIIPGSAIVIITSADNLAHFTNKKRAQEDGDTMTMRRAMRQRPH